MHAGWRVKTECRISFPGLSLTSPFPRNREEEEEGEERERGGEREAKERETGNGSPLGRDLLSKVEILSY